MLTLPAVSGATFTDVNLWGPMVGFLVGVAASALGTWGATKASAAQAKKALEGVRETLQSETERKKLELAHSEQMAELDRAAQVRQHWRDQRMAVYTNAWATLQASGELLRDHDLDLIAPEQPDASAFAERFEALERSANESLAPLALMGSADTRSTADEVRDVLHDWAMEQIRLATTADNDLRRASGADMARTRYEAFKDAMASFNDGCRSHLEL